MLAADNEINKVIHLAKEPTDIPTFTNAGAMQQLSLVSKELLSSDYIVMDVVLEHRAAKVLSEMLLSSTVWFDVTNGRSFVSHANDGLVHDAFLTLSKVR